MIQDRYSHTYSLTAGESDAEGRMPLTLLTLRIIEVATEHANSLGIGYAELIKQNIGWVLSRISIEMERYPRINENYTFTTWIESYNRFFSERNFMILDGEGNVIGHARTVWVAMNFETRSVADLSSFDRERFPIADLPCPIAKTPRIPVPDDDAAEENYTFHYRDIDFNRHVNTVRYLDLILNHWSLEHFDTHTIARFDIMFHNECHYGQTVTMRIGNGPDSCPGNICEIVQPDNRKAVTARIIWK